MSIVTLDCSACKSDQSMSASRVTRFGGIVRLIGYLITIPSVIGVLMGVVIVMGGIDAGNDAAMSGSAGAGSLIQAVGFGGGIFVAGSSLIGGLIGWLLLAKRNVYKCQVCSFVLDRA